MWPNFYMLVQKVEACKLLHTFKLPPAALTWLIGFILELHECKALFRLESEYEKHNLPPYFNQIIKQLILEEL